MNLFCILRKMSVYYRVGWPAFMKVGGGIIPKGGEAVQVAMDRVKTMK